MGCPSNSSPSKAERLMGCPKRTLSVWSTTQLRFFSPGHTSGTQARLAASAPDHLAQKATGIFLEAARNIASLGDQYRQVFGSFRKSPITATYANLSAALALLNPPSQCRSSLNQADQASINSCIQTLKELSTAWTPPGKFHRNILEDDQRHNAAARRGNHF